MNRFALALVLVATAATAAETTKERPALPAIGAPMPDLAVEDEAGHPVHVADFPGRVVVVIHEDRTSAEQNAAFKHRLSRLGKEAERHFVSFAVADVEKYNFWPAKGIVRRELRKAVVDGVIYPDWRGELRHKLGLRSKISTVLIVGRDGRLVYSHEGTIEGPELDSVFRLLHELGVPDLGAGG